MHRVEDRRVDCRDETDVARCCKQDGRKQGTPQRLLPILAVVVTEPDAPVVQCKTEVEATAFAGDGQLTMHVEIEDVRHMRLDSPRSHMRRMRVRIEETDAHRTIVLATLHAHALPRKLVRCGVSL